MNSVHPTHPLVTAREKSQQGRVCVCVEGGAGERSKWPSESWARFNYTEIGKSEAV